MPPHGDHDLGSAITKSAIIVRVGGGKLTRDVQTFE
jgi:hypothetical protein